MTACIGCRYLKCNDGNKLPQIVERQRSETEITVVTRIPLVLRSATDLALHPFVQLPMLHVPFS